MLTPSGVGSVTASDALPLVPFSAALMVVEPAATPVARPAEFTVATAVLATDQVAVAGMSVVPLPLWSMALNCWVEPTLKLAGLGVTEMVDGTVTVNVVVPVMLPIA